MKNGLAFFFVHCAKVKSISISNRENSREDVPLNFLSQLQKWRCHAYIWYLSTTLHNGVVSFLEKHSCFHADVFIYRTRAIITRGLYIFYSIFHCDLHSVRGQNGFFNLVLTERNMDVKLDLMLSVYSLGLDI